MVLDGLDRWWRTVPTSTEMNSGWTALMKAAMGGYLDVVCFLVDHGADIHIKNKDGETALMRAAWGGRLEVVKFLVSKGGDIHTRDNSGWTALMKAAVSGHLAVMRFLVALGAEGHARNNSGETALTWLSRVSTSRMAKRKSGYEEMVDFLRNTDQTV